MIRTVKKIEEYLGAEFGKLDWIAGACILAFALVGWGLAWTRLEGLWPGLVPLILGHGL